MVEVDLIWALGAVGGGVAAYLAFKHRLRQIRKLIDAVDDAVQDDKVSEAEFRDVWELARDVIRGK